MPTIIPKRPARADRSLEHCIRALIHRHDPKVRVLIPRQIGHTRPRYTWDGHTLISSTDTYESVLHDVAHWLVATKKQRAVPEFGLGPDPYRNSDAKAIVSIDHGDRIEYDVCGVQMVLVLALGLDPQTVTKETGTSLDTLEAFQKMRRRYPHVLSTSQWAAARNALQYQLTKLEATQLQADAAALVQAVERTQARHADALEATRRQLQEYT